MGNNNDNNEETENDINILEFLSPNDNEKVTEYVRRKSCQCTACYGSTVRAPRLGELIVLESEKEMIKRF